MQRSADLLRNHVYKRLYHFSFIQWHYCYFIATSLITSLIFWGSSTPAKSVTYIDSLFLCVSAMTEAGLNTVNLSQLNTWQQVILFLLIILGSAIFVSSSILHIRKKAFENKFSEVIERRRRRLHRPRTLTFSFSRWKNSVQASDREAAIASGAVRGRPIDAIPKENEYNAASTSPEPEQTKEEADAEDESTPNGTALGLDEGVAETTGHIRFMDQHPPTERTEPQPLDLKRTPSFFEGRGVGARRLDNHPRHARPMDILDTTSEVAIEDDPLPDRPFSSKVEKYFETINGWVGRNSQFHHLSEEERRKLGGIEASLPKAPIGVAAIHKYCPCHQMFGR